MKQSEERMEKFTRACLGTFRRWLARALRHVRDPVIWTRHDLERALGDSLRLRGNQDFAARTIEVNPAKCRPGTLFVAAREEGDYSVKGIQRALERGAVAAVVQPGVRESLGGGAIWEVEDPLAALGKLSNFARDRFSGKVIVVTGSVGKTSTTALMHRALDRFGLSHRKVSTLGTWVAMATAPSLFDYCVVEAGIGAPGDMERKATFLRPHVGILTNVGLSHAEYYTEPYEILRAKAALFDFLEGERIAIVSRAALDFDDSREGLIRSKNISRLVTVGVDPRDDVNLISAASDGIATRGEMSVFGSRYQFHLPLAGRQFAHNAMFAAACMHVFGLPVADGLAALSDAPPLAHRMERWRVDTPTGALELIDDSKNAAPASVTALLDLVAIRRGPARRLLVLGDMRELGPNSARLHEDLATKIASSGIEVLVTVGPLAELTGKLLAQNIRVLSFAEAAQMAPALKDLLSGGDLVAIKGSGAVGLGRVVKMVLRAYSSRPAGSWRVDEQSE